MKRLFAPVLLILSAGCNTQPAPPPPAAASDPLTNRVWMQTENPDLPGQALIFLSDGTLVADSCLETYRLSSWKRENATHVTWNEDSVDIRAEVQTLTESKLVLKLLLPGDERVQEFAAAKVPYLCADMKR